MPPEPARAAPRLMTGAVHLENEAATARLGARLGAALAPGDTVLLRGGLGAGKTALARAAIAARLKAAGRPAEDIPSPTFTLVQVYEADAPIWHADLYRLSAEEEVFELGLEDAFDAAIAFVEWPERLGALKPPRWLEIALTSSREEGRVATWRAEGAGWAAAAAALSGRA